MTGLIVWLWLVWDMTREIRAGWGRGRAPKKSEVAVAQAEPEPAKKPARDPRDWMSD
ncbi:MAG: hypothetical protein M3O25_05000 [Actinomycetota bacterium]|nr:hypothetical protein [Actinomycetota bacterium]